MINLCYCIGFHVILVQLHDEPMISSKSRFSLFVGFTIFNVYQLNYSSSTLKFLYVIPSTCINIELFMSDHEHEALKDWTSVVYNIVFCDLDANILIGRFNYIKFMVSYFQWYHVKINYVLFVQYVLSIEELISFFIFIVKTCYSL